jgi:DNA-binding NtrC family response regulator
MQFDKQVEECTMTEEKKINTIIVEHNKERARQIAKLLKERSYASAILSSREEMIGQFDGKIISLMILGETADGYSPFQLMKEVVTRSPMTSVILITDASEEDVEEKAEGYGILGAVGNTPDDTFFSLLDNFEKITGALAAP